MTRGRKNTPSAIKRMRGNPGKRGQNHQEPAFEAELPEAPDVLEGDALAEWNLRAAELADKLVITAVDTAVLMLYCQAYADWKHHRMALKNEADFLLTEKGYSYPNPRIGLINTLGDKLARYAAELGMTPASRTKVKTVGKAANPDKKKQSLAESLFKTKTSVKK